MKKVSKLLKIPREILDINQNKCLERLKISQETSKLELALTKWEKHLEKLKKKSNLCLNVFYRFYITKI